MALRVVSDFYAPKVKYAAVPGYKGLYEVDTLGRIYSVRYKQRYELNKIKDAQYINLSKNGVVEQARVAYVVARAFIPNSELRQFVIHKDGNPRNNAAENLEWAESPEKLKPRRGATKYRRVMCVTSFGDILEFESVTQAAEEMMVSRTGILRCIQGKQKKCGGLKWYEI